MNQYKYAARHIDPVDREIVSEAEARQLTLTKPPGSLGMLEEIGNRLAGVAQSCPPPIPLNPHVVVFAGDHGVHAQGVTPWPQAVTVQMVANFLSGGAAINAISRQVGATVTVVDAGVAADLTPSEGLVMGKVRYGSADISLEPAMTILEAEAALDLGVSVAVELIDSGTDLLVCGDMGIANTTASAAIISYFCKTDPSVTTGRGTGIDDPTLARKISVIETAIERASVRPGLSDDPVAVLSELGGLEIGAIAGFILGAASRRIPVIVDGVISLAGALIANEIAPLAAEYMFAGHLSIEPGAGIAIGHLKLKPILKLEMRLGEGTGAAMAIPVLQSAARLLGEMATFESSGVSEA